jgi:hypothetical protein
MSKNEIYVVRGHALTKSEFDYYKRFYDDEVEDLIKAAPNEKERKKFIKKLGNKKFVKSMEKEFIFPNFMRVLTAKRAYRIFKTVISDICGKDNEKNKNEENMPACDCN